MPHDKVALALKWITGILYENQIPFQITGGLAAHAYGATRPFADIDVDIPEEYLQKLLPRVRPFVVLGPTHFRDEFWDLQLMTLNYHDQEIDLGGAYQAKIFDPRRQDWIQVNSDFSTSVMKLILGIEVPVIEKNALIAYKTILSREVDLIDIEMISKKSKTMWLPRR